MVNQWEYFLLIIIRNILGGELEPSWANHSSSHSWLLPEEPTWTAFTDMESAQKRSSLRREERMYTHEVSLTGQPF